MGIFFGRPSWVEPVAALTHSDGTPTTWEEREAQIEQVRQEWNSTPSGVRSLTAEQICDEYVAALNQRAAYDPNLRTRMQNDGALQQLIRWRPYDGWWNRRDRYEELVWVSGLCMIMHRYADVAVMAGAIDGLANCLSATYPIDRWCANPPTELQKAWYRWFHGLTPGAYVSSGGGALFPIVCMGLGLWAGVRAGRRL